MPTRTSSESDQGENVNLAAGAPPAFPALSAAERIVDSSVDSVLLGQLERRTSEPCLRRRLRPGLRTSGGDPSLGDSSKVRAKSSVGTT